jgi:Tfp pilus assembly protein PilX
MIQENEKGYILITVLLLLLVLTVVGMTAIGTSTIENVLSGNIRLREQNLSKAEAGADISASVIEHVVREEDTVGFANIVKDANLANELIVNDFDTDEADTNPDVSFPIDNPAGDPDNVNVDIDKMMVSWMFGSSVEFASGYEGIGKSGGAGFYTFHRINSTGTGLVESEAEVGQIYRYVPK